MTITEAPTTEQVIFDMLTENTGRHMLDSGGAYGRNWERNQGKTLDDFMNAPGTIVERNCYGGTPEISITIDVFHFLRACLDYEPTLDALFDEYEQSEPDEGGGWLPLMEGFPTWLAENHGDEWGCDPDTMTVNTYNGEDAVSQTLQYTMFSMDGSEACWGEYVLLQIHGGCDVRGGYTRPRAFRTNTDNYLFDNARIDVVEYPPDPPQDTNLPGMEPRYVEPFYWTSDNAGYDFYSADSSYPDLGKYEWVWADDPADAALEQVTVTEDKVIGPHGGELLFQTVADLA